MTNDIKVIIAQLFCLGEELRRSALSHSRLISPIGRVPAEILGYIFPLCLPTPMFDERFGDYELPSFGHFGYLNFAHVCQSWRSVALGTPSLWSRLRISQAETKLQTPIRPPILLLLDRSASLPITLGIELPTHEVGLEDAHDPRSDLNTQLLGKVQTLDITCGSPQDYDGSLLSWITAFPNTKRLTLLNTVWENRGRTPPFFRCLTHLHIRFADQYDIETFIELESWHSLISLTLECEADDFPDARISVEAFFSALPDLVELFLAGAEGLLISESVGDSVQQPTVHRNLCRISVDITNKDDQASFFNWLVLPNLTELAVSVVEPDDLAFLLPFVTRSGCRISELTIIRGWEFNLHLDDAIPHFIQELGVPVQEALGWMNTRMFRDSKARWCS